MSEKKPPLAECIRQLMDELQALSLRLPIFRSEFNAVVDADQHRVATSAVRLVALLDTGDRRFLKANLIFALGKGWTIERPGVDTAELSAFDRAKTRGSLAAAIVDDHELACV